MVLVAIVFVLGLGTGYVGGVAFLNGNDSATELKNNTPRVYITNNYNITNSTYLSKIDSNETLVKLSGNARKRIIPQTGTIVIQSTSYGTRMNDTLVEDSERYDKVVEILTSEGIARDNIKTTDRTITVYGISNSQYDEVYIIRTIEAKTDRFDRLDEIFGNFSGVYTGVYDNYYVYLDMRQEDTMKTYETELYEEAITDAKNTLLVLTNASSARIIEIEKIGGSLVYYPIQNAPEEQIKLLQEDGIEAVYEVEVTFALPYNEVEQ